MILKTYPFAIKGTNPYILVGWRMMLIQQHILDQILVQNFGTIGVSN